jgi:hypothetical protein
MAGPRAGGPKRGTLQPVVSGGMAAASGAVNVGAVRATLAWLWDPSCCGAGMRSVGIGAARQLHSPLAAQASAAEECEDRQQLPEVQQQPVLIFPAMASGVQQDFAGPCSFTCSFNCAQAHAACTGGRAPKATTSRLKISPRVQRDWRRKRTTGISIFATKAATCQISRITICIFAGGPEESRSMSIAGVPATGLD